MDSIFATDHTVTTIAGIENSARQRFGQNMKLRPDTTLNAKYNTNFGVAPEAVPTLRYFTIGTQGFQNIGTDTLARPYKPKRKNMSLYRPLPFRVVPVEMDLSATERLKYRMRQRIDLGGQHYYAYWLKVFTDVTDVEVTVVDPVSKTESEYQFDADTWLNPTPSLLDISDVEVDDGERVIVAQKATCTVEGHEVIEAINVMHNGDMRLARISEFGFVTGEDRIVHNALDQYGNLIKPASQGGEDIYEAIYAQLAIHRCTLGTDARDPNGYFNENLIFEKSEAII